MIGLRVCADERLWVLYNNLQSDGQSDQITLDHNFESMCVETIEYLYKASKEIFFSENNMNKVIIVRPVKDEIMPWYIYSKFDELLESCINNILTQNMLIHFLIPLPNEAIYSNVFDSTKKEDFRTRPQDTEPTPPNVKFWFLFRWDNDEEVLEVLKNEFDIDVENVKIDKTEDDKNSINFSKNGNLLAKMVIDAVEENVTLEISGDTTRKLKVKKEDGELNIHKFSGPIEGRFAGDKMLTKLKTLVIQKIPGRVKEVNIKEVQKDYKVFLIENQGSMPARTKRLLKFDSVSTIQKEVKNCNKIQSKLQSDSADDDMFFATTDLCKSVLSHDIIGALSIPVAYINQISTLEDWLQKPLEAGKITDFLNNKLKPGLKFLYEMEQMDCKLISIKEAYSEFFRDVMPVDKRGTGSIEHIFVHEKGSYTIEHIKVREGEDIPEYYPVKEPTLSIRMKNEENPNIRKVDVDLGSLDQLDLFDLYKNGIREEAKADTPKYRSNLEYHMDILASDPAEKWKIFKGNFRDTEEFCEQPDVELINQIKLKNPLYIYNKIYNNDLDYSNTSAFNVLWSNSIHGDLNIKNILVEPVDPEINVKFVDFACLREGPIDFDFAELETDIKVRFLEKTLLTLNNYSQNYKNVESTILEVIHKFEKAIYEDTDDIRFIKSCLNPIEDEKIKVNFQIKFENGLKIIREIRKVRKAIYKENRLDEKTSYWVALFFESLSILGLGEIGKWGKIWAFIAAAIAYEKLTEQIPELEEGKRVEDGSYVERELKKYAGEQKEPEIGLPIPNAKEDVDEFDASVVNNGADKQQENSHIPKTQIVHISETQKEIVRIAVAQFRFELTESFPFVLENKDEVKTKVFLALDIAKQDGADIVCLPELCLCEEWISEIKKKYANMIIIGGSFSKDNKNLCPVIIESDVDVPYQPKITPSDPEIPRMIPGDLFYIYETKFGRFMVLICRDFYNLAHYYRTTDVDMIFCPSYNSADESFQTEAHAHVEKVPSYILIANTGKYGGTSIFGQLHKKHLSSLVDDRCKDAEEVEHKKLIYKLCEVKKGQEEIIIADFNLVHKSVQKPIPANPKKEIKSVDNLKKISIGCCSGSIGDMSKKPTESVVGDGIDDVPVDEFDVFIAYNSKDVEQVTALSKLLEGRGLNPWLNTEQVPPGRWFQDIIQQVIPKVKSATVIIGKAGIGKWQKLELRSFISQCVENDIPVIPVLSPGVNEFPSELLFLKELNWVRFIDKIDEQEALDNLEWGITGEHPQRKQK